MRLLATTGRYAGQIREYPFQVGQQALRSGTAVVPDDSPQRVTRGEERPQQGKGKSGRAR